MRPGDPGDQFGARQGSIWRKTFRVRVKGTNAPVPLTGYGVEFRMRHYFDTTGDPLLRFTRADPELDVDDDAGEVTVTIDATRTRVLPDTVGRAPHEAELDLIPDDDPTLAYALVAGPFPIDPEVIPVDD